MSRKKKSRSLKDKLNVRTGSKQDFIGKGEKGRIPTHNRLAKHKKRQKSAYQKYLEANNLADDSAGKAGAERPVRPAPEPARDEDTAPEQDERKGFDELSGDELLDQFERS